MWITLISRSIALAFARKSYGLAGGLAVVLFSGCGLQQDIDVVLPDYPPQLVVEGYLDNGQIPRLAVSESVPYLASPTPQVPTDVKATLILPNGQRQELRYAPGIDRITGKAFTHVGQRRLVALPGQTFGLELTDTKGRRVTGEATMPAFVPIDTVEWKFNDKSLEERRAYVLTRFRDPAATIDFYRLQIHRDSISQDSEEAEYTIEDRLNNGTEYTLGTSYEFAPDDTLFVTLYHLDPSYYRFLQSVQDARNANGNPFGQPSAIKSTVQGGIGVFTILSYQRRMVIIK